MYGLPTNINLDFFLEKTLLQICIGAHDLILNFDGNVSVTITSSIEFSCSKCSFQKTNDFRRIASTIAVLINQTIVSVEGNEAGTLTLKFDSGGIVTIYDDSKEYESYTIKNQKQIIVV